MDLFNPSTITNILPFDGSANYHGQLLKINQSKYYFDALMTAITWKNDEAIVYGKHVITKRKAAWYGDKAYAYTYSNTTKQALVWTKELLELKAIVEAAAGATYNSCLLNLYHTGTEGMGWHSDDENSLGLNTNIASLSLGAERKFAFKHKITKQSVSIVLQTGSLLIMKGATQSHWLHSLPKTTKVAAPRINLTFRTIIS